MKDEFCSKCGNRKFGTECGHCANEEKYEFEYMEPDGRFYL